MRRYTLRAATGQEAALEAALIALSTSVRALPGSLGVELLEHVTAPGTFVFEERWTSGEAHVEGGALLPRDAMAPVMAALGEKPGIADLRVLQTP